MKEHHVRFLQDSAVVFAYCEFGWMTSHPPVKNADHSSANHIIGIKSK